METSIRAISLDLDGTLLSSRGEIHSGALASVKELADRGLVVIVATARPLRRIHELLPHSFQEYYWTTCNGAWICRRGVILTRTEIPAVGALEFATRLMEYGLKVRIEANDTFYIDSLAEPSSDGTVMPLREYQGHDACKILARVDSDEQIALIRTNLDDHLSMVVTDGDTLVQVARKDCGKLNAVQAVLSMEGLGLQDLLAFGDDNNDTDLLRAAGVGIAMANGTPGALSAADYVTKSNDENGVGQVLRSILKGEPVGDLTITLT